MKILDCETISSTYKSLESISGVDSKEIKSFLINLNIKDIYVGDRSDFILEKFKSIYNPSLKYDLTYWFHLTRIFDPNEFKEGLLPLGEGIDKIWDSLFTFIKGKVTIDEWVDYRDKLENCKLTDDIESNQGFQYRLKIGHKSLGGPYGFLIKDQVLRDTSISTYYLDHPEIIMQISYPFEKLYGYDLLDMYQKDTRPCTVKFKSDYTSLNYIGDALHYLYNSAHDLEMNFHSNNIFDNKGRKISAEYIIKID